MPRSDYYKVHQNGKFGQTLCGKPVTFDAGMCGKRWHEMTFNADEVTCPLCLRAAPPPYVHPEDAPGGPWEIYRGTFSDDDGAVHTSAWWSVRGDDLHLSLLTEQQAIAVRDALNRLKEDKI